MKSTRHIAGILLIVVGILIFVYQGFTYTKPEQLVQIGDIKLIENQEKTVYFPPVLGGIAIIAGVVLLLVGRKK